MSEEKIRLGELQLKILKVLWNKKEASVSEVHEDPEIPENLAYTTVATMLRKMEARHLVSHQTRGRKFIYKAEVHEEAVSKSLAHDVLDKMFDGSLTSMVQHLLTTRDVDSNELKRLEKLIAERKKNS